MLLKKLLPVIGLAAVACGPVAAQARKIAPILYTMPQGVDPFVFDISRNVQSFTFTGNFLLPVSLGGLGGVDFEIKPGLSGDVDHLDFGTDYPGLVNIISTVAPQYSGFFVPWTVTDNDVSFAPIVQGVGGAGIGGPDPLNPSGPPLFGDFQFDPTSAGFTADDLAAFAGSSFTVTSFGQVTPEPGITTLCISVLITGFGLMRKRMRAGRP